MNRKQARFDDFRLLRKTPAVARLLVLSSLFISLTLVQSLVLALPSYADIKPDLVDAYLEREYAWAVYIGAAESKNCLDYAGSRLRPITDVRLYSRKFTRTDKGAVTASEPLMYQQMWYHNGIPLGLRRKKQLQLTAGEPGAVVLGTLGDKPYQQRAAVNALARLLVELQLKQAVASVVLVPLSDYDQVISALGEYKFAADVNPDDGEQMSIHLRSYPWGKDDYLYLTK